MANELTPAQRTTTEEAYQQALQDWKDKAEPGSDMGRFFFFAGAQLGIELAYKIYQEVPR